MSQRLRTGRTTGSCAAAAAMAGVLRLLHGRSPASVAVPLPPGGTLDVPVETIEPEGDGVRVTIIKDGGDDPDATHGHAIQAVITHRPSDEPLTVRIEGGRGVGRATLPGLPVEVGRAAINPEPRKQIQAAARRAAGPDATGTLTITIEVPEGEAIARQTMNPRLGITGGISILGTQGIVKPYSHDSWKATIEEGLDVARALGIDHAVFTTGRRSERLYQETHSDTPEQGLIQAADFFEFAMQAAATRNVVRATWSVFFGKLVKQAQGLPYTHAKTHPVDFRLLARRCREVGCAPTRLSAVEQANTARQVLDILAHDPARPALVKLLVAKARQAAEDFSGGLVAVEYAVFDFDGTRLG